MNYLSTMNEDEIYYVCSVIPLKDTIWYFTNNPKLFARVMPGFRATSLKNQKQICEVLFRSRNLHSITSFIEKHISRWLVEIDEAIREKIDEGESKESAQLQTLPYSYFVDKIGLYFKLVGEELSEELLSLLSESIIIIKKAVKEREEANSKLKEITGINTRLELEIERIKTEQLKVNKRLKERSDEIEVLKRANTDLEKYKVEISSVEKTIVALKKKDQEREEYIQQLQAALSVAKVEQLQLERDMREELIKQQMAERNKHVTALKPLCPKDIEDFKAYLGYNFESIGVPTSSEYYSLLKNHLSIFLFQGKPIIIGRSTWISLVKCVSNTLIESSVVTILEFSNEITEHLIDDFLSQDKRILCLDNFIGNYNETTLITLCERHKDKIIFFTVMYDRTLAHIPNEIMMYCHYLSLNRIEAFMGDKEITEDPSALEEEEVGTIVLVPDSRWSVLLMRILEELGVCGALAVYKSSLVTNESILCCLLAFDILPYCTDVLKIAPFSISEQLVKYAGDYGRCPYKVLFRRWFA